MRVIVHILKQHIATTTEQPYIVTIIEHTATITTAVINMHYCTIVAVTMSDLSYSHMQVTASSLLHSSLVNTVIDCTMYLDPSLQCLCIKQD